MSILIRGMKMPKKCGDCPCMDVDQSCCGITFDDVSSLQISMQGNCPLVEVPTPHGRLLDADDVFHVLTSYYHHSTDFQREALKEALARVSTIIEAEDGE